MELFKHSPIHGGIPGRDFDGLQAEVAIELAEYQMQKDERRPWQSTTADIDQSKCFCYFVQALIFMLFKVAGLPENEIVNGVRGYYSEVLKGYKTSGTTIACRPVLNGFLQGDGWAVLAINLTQSTWCNALHFRTAGICRGICFIDDAKIRTGNL